MADSPRGPLCTTQLGLDWIDDGTLALTCHRPSTPTGACLSNTSVPYPSETAALAAWLIRQGYIRTLSTLLPAAWTTMSESELTSYLATRYSERDLEQMFLMRYEDRVGVKASFRRLNVLAAFLIGLFWARENVRDGQWETALAKVAGASGAAILANKLLYARDATAEAIIASKAGNFGRWFQGAARSNRFVNFFVKGNFLVSAVAPLLMSGPGGGSTPSIPWDLIIEIDIDDETTWRKPPQTLLNMGFNIYYCQVGTLTCYGYIEGSLAKGILVILENTILPKSAF